LIIPRSPTNVTRSAPKRAAALLSCEENVLTSEVSPANSSIDSGRPSASQQADHDLTLARLAIPVVAEGGEGVPLALQIRAGHVVEEHVRRRRREQPALDIGLMLRQPIQIGVEIIFVEADHAERRSRSMAARQANRRQPRALVEHAGNHLPQRQLALPIRAQGRNDAEIARRLRQQPDRPHRGTLDQLQPAFGGARHHAGQVRLVPERQPDRLDLLRLAMGEVGDRAMLDLARLAIGLAQQVAGVGFAVQSGGRTIDEHYDYEHAIKINKIHGTPSLLVATFFAQKRHSTH
jgi:hypothetical protein